LMSKDEAMERVGLSSSMFVRLGLAVAVCVSLPGVVHAVSLVSQRSPTVAVRLAESPANPSANPFGALVIDDESGKPAKPVASAGWNGERHADYFLWMMTWRDLRPELEFAGTNPMRRKAATSRATPLPIGCEALGGVSSGLDQIPGRCLS